MADPKLNGQWGPGTGRRTTGSVWGPGNFLQSAREALGGSQAGNATGLKDRSGVSSGGPVSGPMSSVKQRLSQTAPDPREDLGGPDHIGSLAESRARPYSYGHRNWALYTVAAVILAIACTGILFQTTSRTPVGWDVFNDDTLTTRYMNLLVAPVSEHSVAGIPVFGNSKQSSREYVRYGDFVEFLVGSVDFLFERGSPVDVTGARRISSKAQTAAFTGHSRRKRGTGPDDASVADPEAYVLGESRRFSSYHQRLGNFSSSVSVNATHLNLASIDAISKGNFSDRHGVHVYGKLAFSTYDDGSVHETLTLDPHNAHLRSDNVFLKRHLFVGDDVLFRVHGETQDQGTARTEHSAYLPLLGVSADYPDGDDDDDDDESQTESFHGDAQVVGYRNNVHTVRVATAGARNEYTLNVGSADIDHVNVLAARSTVLGTYDWTGGGYEPSAVFGPAAIVHRKPVYSQHGARALTADSRLATNVVDLAEDPDAGARALQAIMDLRVSEYDLVDAAVLDPEVRQTVPEAEWPVVGGRRISVLAQDLETALPACVQDTQVQWPTVDHKPSGPGTDENPSDFSLVYRELSVKTIDTDALLMHVVLAVQAQQQIIQELRTELRAKSGAGEA